MLDDRSITTVCTVIGGLSTIRLQVDFDINFKDCALFNFVPVDSPSLTFRKKLSQTDNHLTRLTTISKTTLKHTI